MDVELRKKISNATKTAMARPEVKKKLQALKGNGNGFKCGKLNPSYKKRGVYSHLWKGDFASYSAKHHWIKAVRGKAVKCEVCGNVTGRIGWANKDHKYLRVPNDYIALCAKCHTEYDRKYNSKSFGELVVDRSKLMIMFNNGMSLRAIGKEFGISHHTVKSNLLKCGFYAKAADK